MEEGNTLSQTLLPYLNRVDDYQFLNDSTLFIANRFLNSLTQHIIDTGLKVGNGFIIFALKLDPSKLIDIISINDNRLVLKNTFVHLNYTVESADIITKYPQKFLWPELLAFFKCRSVNEINDFV